MTIRVFLADDHAVVREGLQHILDAQPDIIVVGYAEDGQSALDGVERTAPDVAVVDIAMSSQSGVQATRRICEACPETQVVILSMHSTREHVRRALKAGARGYVLKECAGSELVEAVRTVHAGQSYLSQRASDALLGGCGADEEEPLAPLTDRERQVFDLVIEGLSSAEIGERLTVSPRTVETYRSRIYNKLGTDGVVGLVKFAARHELISL